MGHEKIEKGPGSFMGHEKGPGSFIGEALLSQTIEPGPIITS